ncbi:dolichyl-phosphate beta-glucosyltransferase [Balamuthia mandrillaris]
MAFLGLTEAVVLLLAVLFLFISIKLFRYLRELSKTSVLWEEGERAYVDVSTKERKNFPSTTLSPAVTLSVVIPAYNEEKRLPVMLDETLDYLDGRRRKDPHFSFEIIVVDDGSRDKTTKVAHEYAKKRNDGEDLRVLTLLKNRGKGGAVKRGMLCARGEYILMVDADGATKFSDIERLEAKLKKVEENEFGIAVGSRDHLKDDAVAKRSPLRNLLMHGFHMFVLMCVRGIKDTQCGFKLFTRKAAFSVAPSLHIERWAFDVELLYIAQQKKIPIVEVAVNWQEIAGSTLEPLTASIQMARDIFRIRLFYALGVWKY